MSPEELIKAIDKCVRCGKCMSVCPVYKQTLEEGSVARGKIALLKADINGKTDLGKRMKDLLSHCLLCGACAEACAGGVEGDAIIHAGRTMAFGKGGLAKFQSMAAKDLLARGLGFQALWTVRNLFLKKIPEYSGLHFRFPLPGIDKNRWMPEPADNPFLKQASKVNLKKGSGPKIGLFVGCVGNFIRPQSSFSAIRLLQSAGAEIVIPPDQVCCGKPASGAGDDETGRYLAQRNLKAFADSGVDVVTTFCATCSEHLKEYKTLTGIDGGDRFSEKIKDFNETLVHVLDWKPSPEAPSSATPLNVFYHDPCHLRRKQGIYKEPRELLSKLPGIKLLGAEQEPICCGYGGVFNIWHYDLSIKIFNKRSESIVPHKPDVVATTCSGCWLQFKDGAFQLGDPYEVTPLVELLDQYGLPIRGRDV